MRCWCCSLPPWDHLAGWAQQQKGGQSSGKALVMETSRGQACTVTQLGHSACNTWCNGYRAQELVPERGAVSLSLPSLISPAENLGTVARAECHTNEAVYCSWERGWWLGRALPCTRQPFQAGPSYRSHLHLPLPCAELTFPAAVPRGALPPARAAGKASSDQINELDYSEAAVPNSIPELLACFTFCRLPWRRQGAALWSWERWQGWELP